MLLRFLIFVVDSQISRVTHIGTLPKQCQHNRHYVALSSPRQLQCSFIKRNGQEPEKLIPTLTSPLLQGEKIKRIVYLQCTSASHGVAFQNRIEIYLIHAQNEHGNTKKKKLYLGSSIKKSKWFKITYKISF